MISTLQKWNAYRLLLKKKGSVMNIIHLLERIGYHSSSGLPGARETAFFYYNNPDGSVRWLWPAQARRPLFLRFYHLGGWRSYLFVMVTRLLFLFRLQRWLFHQIAVDGLFPPDALVGANDRHWALFSGTAGPNRKALLYRDTADGGTFIKLAVGSASAALLEREHDTLYKLSQMDIQSFAFPASEEYQSGMIRMSALAQGRMRGTGELNAAHLAALSELLARSAQNQWLHALPVWNETRRTLAKLMASRDPRLPQGMLRKLQRLIDQTGDRPVVTCLAHGDFTPWNMYLHGTRVAIYDWELARPELPAGFDAFHFVIQQGILVKRQCWSDILGTLTGVFPNLPGVPPGEHLEYLKLYLIIHTVYYLHIYAQQPAWHRQVYWLLTVWNEGLSSSLQSTTAHRALVLMDLLDFMLHRRYAALKFSNRRPEDLGEFSDLDLCIERKDLADIQRLLARHNLMHHHLSVTRTYMASEQIFCADGSILSIDLIWRLKRKSADMMAVAPIIASAGLNAHGVRSASPIDNARYLALFYALNGSTVPSQYLDYRDHLCGSLSAEDLRLKHFFNHPDLTAPVIGHDVKKRAANRGFSGLKLKLLYAWDVLVSHTGVKGMVITFSGVDGSGKSTVIENLKVRIEKQLRRRTVVLRHRPSLLPILSAWTKGKAAAERASMDRLPRQGTNMNTLSSLLRFAYYYSDYLFGQLWVHFRYVWRGYVVIYDRYYFDFINDGRRSNIILPQWLLRMGYWPIIEPDLNFFLYADAELILSRKQELDKTAIEALTHRYKSLFHQLGRRHKRSRYIPIENVELSSTLRQIMGSVQDVAA